MHLGLKALEAFLASNRDETALVLATVIATEGSTYRKPGAMSQVNRLSYSFGGCEAWFGQEKRDSPVFVDNAGIDRIFDHRAAGQHRACREIALLPFQFGIKRIAAHAQGPLGERVSLPIGSHERGEQ